MLNKKILSTVFSLMIINSIAQCASLVEDPIPELKQRHGYLQQYSSGVYNALVTPEIAELTLKKEQRFEEFLRLSFDEIVGKKLPIGFRLIHRHHTVPEGGGMVETFMYNEDNNPILCSKVSGTELVRQACPASWIVHKDFEGKLSFNVLEFSTDSAVREIQGALEESHMPLMISLATRISEFGLNELIAIAILGHSQLDQFEGSKLVEIQDSNSSYIMRLQDGEKFCSKGSLFTKTSWGPRTVACLSDHWCKQGYDSFLDRWRHQSERCHKHT